MVIVLVVMAVSANHQSSTNHQYVTMREEFVICSPYLKFETWVLYFSLLLRRKKKPHLLVKYHFQTLTLEIIFLINCLITVPTFGYICVPQVYQEIEVEGVFITRADTPSIWVFTYLSLCTMLLIRLIHGSCRSNCYCMQTLAVNRVWRHICLDHISKFWKFIAYHLPLRCSPFVSHLWSYT